MGYVHKVLIGIKMYLSNCAPAHNYIESTHRYRCKIISLTPKYNLCNSNHEVRDTDRRCGLCVPQLPRLSPQHITCGVEGQAHGG